MMDVIIPDKVKSIMNYLEDSGFEVFVVGGCVRDIILGNIPNDWDMCTNGKPEEIIDALHDKFKVIPTGLKHGTVTVVSEKNSYEITTYRKENGYSDGRHPDSVEFVPDIYEDLKRRDFTVNAMAYNEKVGLIDLFGGREDLNKRIIRSVGNPKERFLEDALRILRGIRFAGKLSFDIEEKTAEEIHNLKETLKNVSKERIFDELRGILVSNNPPLKEFEAVFKEVLAEDIIIDSVFEKLPQSFDLKLSAILRECDYKKVLNDLKCDTRTKTAVSKIIENKSIKLPKDKKAAKLFLKDFGENKDILLFSKVLNNIREREYNDCVSLMNDIALKGECYSLKQLKLTGNDLIERGYKGKEIKDKLNEILMLVIDEKINNERDELLKNI